MGNQKMETIGDFIKKQMSASPIIINSICSKLKINENETLLNYVIAPIPRLKSLKKTKKKENESQSDFESASESENESEDEMYAEMTESEKITAMILDNDKFNVLMQCFNDFESMIEALHTKHCKGYILSKRISLNPMHKKINVFVKKQRRKQ